LKISILKVILLKIFLIEKLEINQETKIENISITKKKVLTWL
jgi:hypothetical protein